MDRVGQRKRAKMTCLRSLWSSQSTLKVSLGERRVIGKGDLGRTKKEH